jgi:hypothetical protein
MNVPPPAPPSEPPTAHRGTLRALVHGLSHPTGPPTPLLSHAQTRWVRRLPYVIAIGLTVWLLFGSYQVLIYEYGLKDGVAGALAVAPRSCSR